jgi:hypothetical protein
VTALTGSKAPADEDGIVIDASRKGQMNAKQQIVTILMAALMLATILLMPDQHRGRAGAASRQSGTIAAAPDSRSEQRREAAGDMTHH